MTHAILLAAIGEQERHLVEAFGRRRRLATVVRRCGDLAELVATAESGQGNVAVIVTHMPQLDREVVSRLQRLGKRVVLVEAAPAQAGSAASRVIVEPLSWAYLGADLVLGEGVDADEVVHSAIALARSPVSEADDTPVGAVSSDLEATTGPGNQGSTVHPGAVLPDGAASAEDRTARPGRIVAFWGATGAPGRTTLAVNVAVELAEKDPPVILIDADTYSGSIAMALGLLDESAGLLAAVRGALRDALDGPALSALLRTVTPGLGVLTGIDRASRWPELRTSGLEVVWRLARERAAWIIVDCGFSLEQDEVLSFDTRAPERNGATISAIRAADQVVIVAGSEPSGMVRLCHGLDELATIIGPATFNGPVVVNRVRSSVDGPRPRSSVERAVALFAGRNDVRTIPDDPAACDKAVATGRALREAAPGSMALADIKALASELIEIRDSVAVQVVGASPQG